MKSVLSVQDLSCVGRCSLTVALPVLSAMGVRCSVLPTAVLSTHTGFPEPAVLPLTGQLRSITAHWESLGLTFDTVTCGYLAGPEQANALLPLLRGFKDRGSCLIVDPAMGDHGKLYRRLGEDHVAAMAQLCMQADILLPNLTEAALLTDLPYRDRADEACLRALTGELLRRYPARAVLITGVSGQDGTVGFYGALRDGQPFSYRAPLVPRQCHGTGDLFTAVFAGATVQGAGVFDAGVRAADFVRHCVAATPDASPHGVAFETQIFRLLAEKPEKSY